MTHDARHDPDFVDRTEAVVRLGSMLLSAGTGAYRVKHAMARAAEAMGMDRHDASVSLTEITTTTHRGDDFRTMVREVPRVAVDAARIDALEKLSRHLPDGCTAQYLDSWLDYISRHVKAVWALWINLLASGLACAAFAILNHFNLVDALVVVVAAAIGQAVRRTLSGYAINQFGAAALSAAAACLAYLLLNIGFTNQPWHVLHGVDGSGYVAAILFLIPGFPMITSILDIARLDFTAGLPRAFYAFGLILSAGAAAWGVSMVTGLEPLPAGVSLPGEWWWFAALVSSFIGICGFAVLFNSPANIMWRAACAGTIGNMVRLIISEQGVASQAAAFIGGFIVGMCAWALSKVGHLPRITLSVPGAVIMVPGTAMYRMLYWFNARDTTQALSYGFDALATVLAIAFGLAVARMFTDKGWTQVRWRTSPHAFRSLSDELPD